MAAVPSDIIGVVGESGDNSSEDDGDIGDVIPRSGFEVEEGVEGGAGAASSAATTYSTERLSKGVCERSRNCSVFACAPRWISRQSARNGVEESQAHLRSIDAYQLEGWRF